MGNFIGFFSSIFGYVLNAIYEIVKNYGLAIILFSIILKIILLPISIKQQKTMKKTARIQEATKELQNKYKNDTEKMNKEIMDLYKRENMSPFSGCLSAIIQIILLFAMFYLVKSPLTYMKKVESQVIENYSTEIKQELGENSVSVAYPEISIIKYINQKDEEKVEEQDIRMENVIVEEENNSENEILEEKINIVDKESLKINMNFLGLDLSNVPKENWQNPTVFIIPVLYVLTTVISMRLTTNINQKKKKEIVINKDSKEDDVDMAAQMNKSMLWMMPIMSVSISLIAPLGLALYWLINNVLMIVERISIDKILNSKEENEDA